MRYVAIHTKKGWRIVYGDIDLCGAVSETVAWQQCSILNAMREL